MDCKYDIFQIFCDLQVQVRSILIDLFYSNKSLKTLEDEFQHLNKCFTFSAIMSI